MPEWVPLPVAVSALLHYFTGRARSQLCKWPKWTANRQLLFQPISECILRLIATEIAPRTADAVEAEYGDDYATASDDEEEVEKRAKERRKQRANSKWQKANGKAAGLPEYRRSECGCCGD